MAFLAMQSNFAGDSLMRRGVGFLIAAAALMAMVVESEEQRRTEMNECAAYFTKLWNERVNSEPRNDLISMMAHSDATRYMTPDNLMGNIILLIVGGNDTTRNSMTGSVLALNENPDQYQKLRENPALIETMVPEVIRWQTPLAHMRRTALVDTEIGGKTIRKGDRVVMWYVSGNRDEEVIERPNEFIIDRARPKIHMSFGFGIHRCVGMPADAALAGGVFGISVASLSMVPEVIRWQTPLAHMRRTALVDTEIGGKKIRKGDRVVMWYVSGNRDEEGIERPDEFIIDRARPRTHLSFGFGIHRCVGMRLAELQLRIVWQEILKRFDKIEVVGEPKRIYSSFIKGYETLPVRIPG